MKIALIVLLSLGLTMGLLTVASASFEDPIHTIVVEHEYLPMPVDYPTVPDIDIAESDATLIAKTLWGEARGCSLNNQRELVWCILNRVDDPSFPATIAEVITQPYQLQGYSEKNPVDAELYAVAIDVLVRWQMEQYCIGDVGRVLPREYVYFGGNGVSNRFRDAYDIKCANYWEGE